MPVAIIRASKFLKIFLAKVIHRPGVSRKTPHPTLPRALRPDTGSATGAAPALTHPAENSHHPSPPSGVP